MAVGDWTVSDWTTLVAGIAGVYLLWKQNQIFERQNEIFARQAGQTAMRTETSQMPWIGRYWPTMIMVGLMALTAYDIYDRHRKSPSIPWWLYGLLLLIAAVAGLAIGRLTTKAKLLPGSKKLEIRSARYQEIGSPNYRDVTQRLMEIAADGLVIPVDYTFLGCDPAPGNHHKRLVVDYVYGDLPQAQAVGYEGGKLILPQDPEIQRLMNEVKRLTPVVPKITKLSDQVEYVDTAAYPLKLRVHLRNDSTATVDVQFQEYRPELITVRGVPTEVFQVRLRDLWYPKEHGAGRIALYPGQQFLAWIAPDEGKFNKVQVEGYRGRIGTIVLLVNGQNIEIKL